MRGKLLLSLFVLIATILITACPTGEKNRRSSQEILWHKIIGGKGYDWANGVSVLPDGSIVVAGGTLSYEGVDMYVIKLDSDGNKIWEKHTGREFPIGLMVSIC